MDQNLSGVYFADLSGAYDWEVVEGQDGPDDLVREDADGKLRRRVYHEATDKAFGQLKMVIRDPAQIPLDSLTRYVRDAVIKNSAPVESVLSVRSDMSRSSADERDVHNVGRKIAAMLECDYIKE